MPFRVTQCPACESTFNTSPAVLESAAGRVRCGACLTVFEARENFVDIEPEQQEQEQESVFLSQSPEQYFDPSRFLTRQSLRESIEEDPLPGAAEDRPRPEPDQADLDSNTTTEDSELSAEAAGEEFVDQEAVDEEALHDETVKESFLHGETVTEDDRDLGEMPEPEPDSASTAEEIEFMDLVAAGTADSQWVQQELTDEEDFQPATAPLQQVIPRQETQNDIQEKTQELTEKKESRPGDNDREAVTVAPPEEYSDPLPEPTDTEPETALSATASVKFPESAQWPGQDQSMATGNDDQQVTDSTAFTDSASRPMDAGITQRQLPEAATPTETEPEAPAQTAARDAPHPPQPPLAPPAFAAEPYRPENFRLHAQFSVQTTNYSEPPQAEQQSEKQSEDTHTPSGSDADLAESQAEDSHKNLAEDTHTPQAEDTHTLLGPDANEVDSDDTGQADPDQQSAEQQFNAALEEQEFQEALQERSWQQDAPDVELPDAAEQDSDESIDTQVLDIDELEAGVGDLPATGSELSEQSPVSDDDSDSEAQAGADSDPELAEEPDQSLAAIRARALQAELEDDQALESIPEENLKVLGEFSTPVEIIQGRRAQLGRRLAWTLTALLAAMLLAVQYLWQELPRYSQLADLRPLYEWACNIVRCELPVYSDIDSIQSSNLSVRSHPRRDDALAVNVEFRNNASFAQEFPIMVLSFNSASNNVIALREFAPEEYLDESLRNRRLLPPETPVQVALEIMDPGDDAVNYTLAFRRP